MRKRCASVSPFPEQREHNDMASIQQTITYKRRLREHSGLSPLARLVALTIADLRWEAKRRDHEPLPLTYESLAAACGMKRRSVVRYLNECLESGWIVGRRVFRDGRQKPNEYFICDVTEGDTECRRVHSVVASGGQLLSARVAHNCDMRLHTVVRSNNNGGSATEPSGAVDDPDEQGHPTSAEDGTGTAAPAPALEGAGPDAADDAWRPFPKPRVLDECPQHGRAAEPACVGCRRARQYREQNRYEMQPRLSLRDQMPPDMREAPVMEKLRYLEEHGPWQGAS